MSDIRKIVANLSPAKRALVEHYLMEQDKALKEQQEIPRRGAIDHIPLSFAQQRLWLFKQFDPSNPVYNIPFAVHLIGSLDIAALEMSINEIVKRHEALRTTFSTLQGKPVQIILPPVTLKLQVRDLRELPKPQREVTFRQMLVREAQRPFDLAKDLFLRTTLLCLDDEKYVLLLTAHHIVTDVWSMGILFSELSVLYNSFVSGVPSPLTELPIQYADFAIWQRKWLQGDILEEQLSYWKEQLDGASFFLELPTDRPRPAIQAFRGAHYSLVLPLSLSTALKVLSRKEKVTLFMILLAGFKILLYRYTGQKDIVIGSPVANRNRLELEELIGFFVNTLVLRTKLSGNPTFREMLERIREVCLGAYAHQDLPFEKLVEEFKPERTLSHSPLFQIMFNLQNAPRSSLQLSGLALHPQEVDGGTAKFDLTLTMVEKTNKLHGVFEYDTDLFEEATIKRMALNFQTILESIVADPDLRLSKVPLLTFAEQHQLIKEWNDIKIDYPRGTCIHHLFEEQVERCPESIALVYADQQISYLELNQRSNQLAHYLTDMGVGPNVLVGLFVDRSIDMVIGLLGILKSGGAYLPLDPDYPKGRLSYMQQQAKSPVIITQTKFEHQLPHSDGEIIFIDADWDKISTKRTENPALQTSQVWPGPDNLAYTIFTSGSTGKPKGVQVPHRGVTNFLSAMIREPGLSSDDNVLALATLSFDIHVLELFAPLIVGAKAIIADREAATNGQRLIELLEKAHVSFMQATPGTWRLLIAAGWQGSKQLKALCGAEPFPKDLVEKLIVRVASLWNMYGPTETTVWATCCQLKNATDPILVGRPIANTQTYVLDDELQPVPIGVPGELYIGGDGVTHGYLNRPELTSKTFIPDSFSEKQNAFIYKTGDLVKYHPDGSIEYLNRLDNQVKIRGFRVELGEIEASLTTHPFIDQAVVCVKNLGPSDQRLIGYMTTQKGEAITLKEVRDHLIMQLPEYMVPQHVAKISEFPLTPSGKVDRKSLPWPIDSLEDANNEFAAPQNETERMLCSIWEEIFNKERIGINDNFFNLGGHSLLATQIISRIVNAFRVNISLRSFFQAPTVADMAAIINQKDKEKANLKYMESLLDELEAVSDEEAR